MPMSGRLLAVFGRVSGVGAGAAVETGAGVGSGAVTGCAGEGGGTVTVSVAVSFAVTRETLPDFHSSIDVPSLSTAMTGSPEALAIIVAWRFG